MLWRKRTIKNITLESVLRLIPALPLGSIVILGNFISHSWNENSLHPVSLWGSSEISVIFYFLKLFIICLPGWKSKLHKSRTFLFICLTTCYFPSSKSHIMSMDTYLLNEWNVFEDFLQVISIPYFFLFPHFSCCSQGCFLQSCFLSSNLTLD